MRTPRFAQPQRLRYDGMNRTLTALTDVAQVIYLNHRGNGRSDDGPAELWTLAQWADDLAAFCDALGIVKPSFTALRLVEWWRWRARHTVPSMLASWRG